MSDQPQHILSSEQPDGPDLRYDGRIVEWWTTYLARKAARDAVWDAADKRFAEGFKSKENSNA